MKKYLFFSLGFILLFSFSSFAASNEVTGFILKNFPDPRVSCPIIRSGIVQFEKNPEGIKFKDADPSVSDEKMKPAELQAFQALEQRELKRGGRPEFIFPRNIRSGYSIRYAGKTLRLKHNESKADASFENSAVVYKNAYRDTDILYVYDGGACQEMILLRSNKAPSKFIYAIDPEPAGDVGINEKGEVIAAGLALSKPVIIDATGKKIEGHYRKTDKGIILEFDTDGLTYPILIDPTWAPTVGPMAYTRSSHTATLLPNGKVLIAGGSYIDPMFGYYRSSAELFDPSTGTFEAAGNMNDARGDHTATLLPSGKVLLAGGHTNSGAPIYSAELYDPSNGTFSYTGSLNVNRAYHTATLLANGKVLIAGGTDYTDPLSSAEVYDPDSGMNGTFTPITNAMKAPRMGHTATLLPNGNVLLAGGYRDNTAELYDPVANTFTSTVNSMTDIRQYHTATLLPSGNVLVAGGFNDSSDETFNSVDLYDSATRTFSAITPMNATRQNHTATLLPDGRVLITGGFDGDGFHFRPEIFDPSDNSFTYADDMLTARAYHTATLLPSGNVLITGGFDGSNYLSSSEVFQPSAGMFEATGSMSTGRAFYAATLLSDGTVLVTGGGAGGGDRSADVYDPLTGHFTPTLNDMTYARVDHTATLLPNGKVLIAGGGPITAEIYEPGTKKFSPTGTMQEIRSVHTATLLPNGKVLIAGGQNTSVALSTAELYDPFYGTFSSAAGIMSTIREQHTATLLPNGKVLLAGGSGSSILASTDLFDPLTETFSSGGSMLNARFYHTATLLPDGNVLIAGGGTGAHPDAGINSAEIYDPLKDQFFPTGHMATARIWHTATLLPNGNVLIAGGGCYDSGYNITDFSSAELYDPSTRSFSFAGNMTIARRNHTAILLPNGKFLIVGGINDPNYLPSAELAKYSEYDYAIYPNMRPSITSFTSTIQPNTVYGLIGLRFKGTSEASGGNGATNSPTNYPRVYLKSLQSERLFDVSTSEYPLTWSGADTSISFRTPSDLTYGNYLLTVVTNAVPSDSKLLSYPVPPLPTTSPTLEWVKMNGIPFRSGDIISTSSEVKVRYMDEQGVATIELFVDGGLKPAHFALTPEPPMTTFEGTWRGNISIHTPGVHALTFRSSDSYGNTGDNVMTAKVGGGSVQMVGGVYNYPNPFRPMSKQVTNIQYVLSTDASITMIIYDITGHEVKRMKFVSGTNGGRGGTNQIIWDGSTMGRDIAGNGMYLYKLISGDKVIGSGKMVVFD